MDKPRIAFFNPPVGLFNERNVLQADASAVPTIGRFTYRDEMTPPDASLLFMANIARRRGWCPEYYDANVGGIPDDLIPLQRAVILLTTHQALAGYRLADTLRRSGCRVAFFGPHATALPDEALAHGDAVLCGEGETSLPLWLDSAEGGIFRVDTVMDLANLPALDYGVLRPDNHRVAPLLSSRGCGRGCRFCWQLLTAGRRYRRRPVEAVRQDAETLLRLHPGLPALFMDDNMFQDRFHARAVLEAIAPLRLRWSCQSDLTVAEDESLLDLARDAGCLRMLIGFESTGAEALRDDAPFKAVHTAFQAEAVERIQARGIGVVGSFIIGFDSDSHESIEQLARFIDTQIMANVSISILAPPPGTPLFQQLEREGRLLTRHWDDYNQCSVVFEPRGLRRDQLEEAARMLFRRAHSPQMRRRRVKYFLERARKNG